MSSNSEATQALLSLCGDKRRWKAELTVDAVRKLLAEGADVNARDVHGQSALHHAVQGQYQKGDPLPDVAVVRALIEAGADVNARDNHQQTPLTRAFPSEKTPENEALALELIALLKAAGGKVPSDVVDGNGAAFRWTTARLLKEVLDAGARLDARNERGGTPLHSAVVSGDPNVIQLMLERGAEVNAIDGQGRTALGIALRTKEEVWVAHNKRTAGFNAVIQVLEAAGGKASVSIPLSDDVFAPYPIDEAAFRGALAEKKQKLSFKHAIASAQEAITGLHGHGDPAEALGKLETLRDTLTTPPRKVHIRESLSIRSAFFHHGDLEVDGNLDIGRPFAVTGDVIVHGVVWDSGNDSLVNILGKLTCHGLYSSGEFSVAQDIEARDVVLGYYNDHLLSANTIRARVVIEDDHAFDARTEAQHHFDIDTYAQGYGDGVAEELKALFVDEVFETAEETDEEEDGEPARLDKGELFHRISKGLPVFRE
ncbi:ankyrin repeat domain-containing protein [Myxococcus sp. XM-1-1-1]|uniref:ankyrin repeat domain-containing protein n=1 Tax=Myxococcus sp. XM-1-1-1 TaxID=2874602 RepID=UPI001CBE59C3|nr:ankyrin repeat domain-containing protein [Myxococcus sp. XM-1-1-1]MBZ4411846.1 ankyrin repeat domain-containing protein [Myxococcus sp. XM-1-1-1]